jgi:hypothetical protein
MAQNYGYETLMTELPTYMKQVLRFSIRQVSFHLSAAPNMIDVNVVASCGVTIYHMHFSLFPFTERYFISASISRHVDILEHYFVCCRLYDREWKIYTHDNEEDN